MCSLLQPDGSRLGVLNGKLVKPLSCAGVVWPVKGLQLFVLDDESGILSFSNAKPSYNENELLMDLKVVGDIKNVDDVALRIIDGNGDLWTANMPVNKI